MDENDILYFIVYFVTVIFVLFFVMDCKVLGCL